MAIFVELVTDAFEDVFDAQVHANQSAEGRATRAGKVIARRPVRGLEVKDATFASIKVVLSNGQEWPLLDSSSPDGFSRKGYTNFILQQVTEDRMEKHQIVETFGDAYVFFFGENPRFLLCSAILINSLDFNWEAEWWFNYDNYLRGTKLVELGARCYMFWDDTIVEGYMLNAQSVKLSDQPMTVTLQFRFFVTKYQNVSLVNVEQYPIRSSVVLPEGVELTAANAFDKMQEFYRGGARDERLQDAMNREGPVILGAAQQSPPPANKITQKLRQYPSSMVVDPAIWNVLTGVVGIANPDQDIAFVANAGKLGNLRGLIAENVDEYVGGNAQYEYGATLPSSLSFVGLQEAESLEQDTLGTLQAIGADVDNDHALRDLGLGPNFSSGYAANQRGSQVGGTRGAGVSFGGSVSAGATVSFGVLPATARSGASSIGANDPYMLQAPLRNVYSRPETGASEFSPTQRQVVEGAGDYGYGYKSAYGGVGFGQAGYGDMGGTGFGSANALGDPGYLDPELFSRRGVSDNAAAFGAWVRPRLDGTALTSGPVLGGTTVTGGASIVVGGRQTAFALVPIDGQLSDWVVIEGSGDIGGSTALREGRLAQVIVGPGTFG